MFSVSDDVCKKELTQFFSSETIRIEHRLVEDFFLSSFFHNVTFRVSSIQLIQSISKGLSNELNLNNHNR